MIRKSMCVPPRRRLGGMVGGLIVCVVLCSILGYAGYWFAFDRGNAAASGELITETVTRGPFDHIVLEQGEIESSQNTEVICEVKSRGYSGVPILWVIDEGSRVKAGEKLVELDSSTIETELRENKIKVIAARANVTSAEAAVEQAEISKQEYLEGVFKTEESTIESEIAVAEQNLRKAKLELESSGRLLAKGLIKELQLDADKFAVVNADNLLKSAKARLRVLQNLTKKKMLVQFESDIDAAKAQLAAFQSSLEEEEQELADVEMQLKKCIINAPADGIVVHANKFSSRGGSAEFVVEPGASVRERQAIIRLPDPTQMQIKCKINESRITLITDGMPVKISVDAIAGLKLNGRVKKVNRYAEPNSFFSGSIKEYATFIEILEPPETIRTGMTAEVQIFVEQIPDAVQIPIQGVYEHGDKMYSLIQRGEKEFETVEVKIGATNDSMATIESGLSENDEVVLNLRDHLNLMDLPEIKAEDNSDMKKYRTDPTNVAETGDASGKPDGARGGRRPGGPGGGRQGGGGRPRGEGGRGGGGRPEGGGRPSAASIVNSTFERNDTNKDGKLSADEINAVDEQWRSGLQQADTDGDGNVTRAELTAAMQKRFSGGGS